MFLCILFSNAKLAKFITHQNNFLSPYTTEVGQTMLNQTVLAMLYKSCWPGLVELTTAQFYDCYTVQQTGLTHAGPQ